MSNRQQIMGHWNEVKGRLKEHWGELTDDDLQQAEGSTDQLVGVVQQKTGAARSEVERQQQLERASGRDRSAVRGIRTNGRRRCSSLRTRELQATGGSVR